MPLLAWHIKSTTKAQQGLYEYDAVSRLRDSQLGDARVKDIENYIVKGVLWQAFEADEPGGAADRRDRQGRYRVSRTTCCANSTAWSSTSTRRGRPCRRSHRPLVVITSNNEKELPDAFLRRCFFHYIKFPDKDTMQAIVDVHFPKLRKELLQNALAVFFGVRDLPGLKKKPSTSELLDWLKLLVAEQIPPEALRSKDDKLVRCRRSPGALLKNEQDMHLFERLVFMARSNR